MRWAIGRAYDQTDAFKDRYRWVSGVQGTMSGYDGRTRVKHLRVKGVKAVRFCATLKAIAVSIFGATAVRRAVNNAKAGHAGVLPTLMDAIYVVKERFLNALGPIGKNLHSIWPPLWASAHNDRVMGV